MQQELTLTRVERLSIAAEAAKKRFLEVYGGPIAVLIVMANDEPGTQGMFESSHCCKEHLLGELSSAYESIASNTFTHIEGKRH